MACGIDATGVSAFAERGGGGGGAVERGGGAGVVAQDARSTKQRIDERRRMDLSQSKKTAPAVFAAGARGYVRMDNVTAGSDGSRRGGCADGLRRSCCRPPAPAFRGLRP